MRLLLFVTPVLIVGMLSQCGCEKVIPMAKDILSRNRNQRVNTVRRNDVVKKNGLIIDRVGSADPKEMKFGAVEGWMMSLPEDNGFAPNINWLAQDADGKTLRDYMDLTLKQYDQMNAEVLRESIVSESDCVIDVVLQIIGKNVRCYQRCIKDGDMFHIVTASALDTQWDEYSERLVKCVNSARPE